MIVPSVQRLVAFVGLAAAVLLLALEPAAAQRGFFLDSLFGGFSQPRQSQPRSAPVERQAPAADYTRAPAPKKLDPPPASTVLVLGDSMADWLAYGLEEALGDTPEFGVIRKNRAFSGLIRYDSRADAPDWTQVAREAIAADKPNYIVIMLGLNDRQAIRERLPAARGATPQAAPAAATAATAAPEQPNAEQDPAETPPAAAPAPEPAPARGRAAGASHEFRTDKWGELYGRRIDEMIAVLKARGVPVFWVGLPPIRGTRSSSDMVYLNDMIRSHAEKAGIAFIDVWDGFVDEAGRFTLQGPDVDGQIRKLRAGDGVHFTRFGARKLAHFLEREIKRASERGPVEVALPTTEPQSQAPGGKAGGATPRPLAGPVLPLTSPMDQAENLLGGGNAAEGGGHVTATRVLVKGEPLPPPAGRSDDFAWPRRGVAPFGTDPVVATTTLPLPEMKPPPAKTTVAAPTVEPAAAAAAPRRTVQRAASEPRQAAPQAPRARESGGFPSFFPFRW